MVNNQINVARGWDGIAEKVVTRVSDESKPEVVTQAVEETPLVVPAVAKPKRSYRWIIVLASIGIFLIVAIFSSFYLFWSQPNFRT